MIIDGLEIIPNSPVKFTSIEQVSSLPTTDLFEGREVELVAPDNGNEAGPYTYSQNAWKYNAGQPAEILALAKAQAESDDATALASAKSYADSKDATTLASAKSYADTGDASTLAASKAYTDNATTAVTSAVESYADTKDAATLAAAKAYTDNKQSSGPTQTYVDNADASTLASAKSYADTHDASTLSSANSHADSGDAATLAAANSHADSGDTSTLNSSKSYTNARLVYDIGYSLPGALSASQVLMKLNCVRAFSLPQNLALSIANCDAAPTGAIQFTIAKNGTAVGTINFAAGANSATFTFLAAVNFAAGDVLMITAPAVADTTFAGIAFTLAGAMTP